MSNENEATIETEAGEPSAPTACYAFERPWTWKDRLRVKLFPPNHCDIPEAPASFKDALICKVDAELSFIDRLRVLFTGRFRVEAKTITENTIGGHRTNTVGYSLPPKWWDRKA